MSALTPKADVRHANQHVCSGPTGDSRIATNGCLFDQFIGAGKQRRRHAKAQCLRSLEIDDELKSGGKLYRQIGRLRAFENLVNQSAARLYMSVRFGS